MLPLNLGESLLWIPGGLEGDLPIAIQRLPLTMKICIGGNKMGFFDDLVGKVTGAIKGPEGNREG